MLFERIPVAVVIVASCLTVAAGELRIRINDQASLEAGTLRVAMGITADLFRQTGLHADVVVCGDCPAEIDPDEVIIRIVPRRSSELDNRLGMSFVTGSTGRFATVYAPT